MIDLDSIVFRNTLRDVGSEVTTTHGLPNLSLNQLVDAIYGIPLLKETRTPFEVWLYEQWLMSHEDWHAALAIVNCSGTCPRCKTRETYLSRPMSWTGGFAKQYYTPLCGNCIAEQRSKAPVYTRRRWG